MGKKWQDLPKIVRTIIIILLAYWLIPAACGGGAMWFTPLGIRCFHINSEYVSDLRLRSGKSGETFPIETGSDEFYKIIDSLNSYRKMTWTFMPAGGWTYGVDFEYKGQTCSYVIDRNCVRSFAFFFYDATDSLSDITTLIDKEYYGRRDISTKQIAQYVSEGYIEYGKLKKPFFKSKQEDIKGIYLTYYTSRDDLNSIHEVEVVRDSDEYNTILRCLEEFRPFGLSETGSEADYTRGKITIQTNSGNLELILLETGAKSNGLICIVSDKYFYYYHYNDPMRDIINVFVRRNAKLTVVPRNGPD